MNETALNPDIVITVERWNEACPDLAALVARCSQAVAKREAVQGDVCFLFTDDAYMQQLNRDFRGKDKPTNVLSFPGPPDDAQLGDIALGLETCDTESTNTGISMQDHTAHLLVHGLLHLIGYDHMDDSDASIMETRESEILASLGIADPYHDEEIS